MHAAGRGISKLTTLALSYPSIALAGWLARVILSCRPEDDTRPAGEVKGSNLILPGRGAVHDITHVPCMHICMDKVRRR